MHFLRKISGLRIAYLIVLCFAALFSQAQSLSEEDKTDPFYMVVYKTNGDTFMLNMDEIDSIGFSTSESIPISPVEESMKVVVLNLNPTTATDLFYIRTQYNESKDVIVTYRQNGNGVITQKSVSIGSKTLSDAQLMGTGGTTFTHRDSTAPFFSTKNYWHLFAQHGYVVPTMDNHIGMTDADVGTEWKDQLGRMYTIGEVSPSCVVLLPIITPNLNGHNERGWKWPTSLPITQLIHESDGVVDSVFVPTGLKSIQLRPLMKAHERKFMADGQEITTAGVYCVKNFQVSEVQDGYDPATVSQWFPTPILENAEVMAQFYCEYNFTGAQCSVHTSVDVLRSLDCVFYGATQQQTFFDTDGYKAMFMIPKAAPQQGVELDRPFHSPSASSPNYPFYRTEEYLRDVNDPIDRCISCLYNASTDNYLLGMAAGLSLVSGSTQKENRLADLPVGSDNTHYYIGIFSPENINKFYIAAFNTAPYSEDDYYLPCGFHRDIDYYVCFFDPAANEGQVYWYKDGNRYVIYAHCQTQHDKLDITVPDIMNGCILHIVEKTPSAELLSETILDGRFSVKYADSAANFIVLTATPPLD